VRCSAAWVPAFTSLLLFPHRLHQVADLLAGLEDGFCSGEFVGLGEPEGWGVDESTANEPYDWNSKLIKRFQVTKVQEVDGATTLKEMKIESFNPFDGSRKGRTYMTMDNPVKK
jgi:hypothetical protein